MNDDRIEAMGCLFIVIYASLPTTMPPTDLPRIRERLQRLLSARPAQVDLQTSSIFSQTNLKGRAKNMQKRSLGLSGLSIAPIVLGGNVFGWTMR